MHFGPEILKILLLLQTFYSETNVTRNNICKGKYRAIPGKYLKHFYTQIIKKKLSIKLRSTLFGNASFGQ